MPAASKAADWSIDSTFWAYTGRSSEPASLTWPGPDPESFLTPTDKHRAVACGELTGDTARAAYRAALANPGASWLVDGASRILAVNPLPLPGSCP